MLEYYKVVYFDYNHILKCSVLNLKTSLKTIGFLEKNTRFVFSFNKAVRKKRKYAPGVFFLDSLKFTFKDLEGSNVYKPLLTNSLYLFSKDNLYFFLLKWGFLFIYLSLVNDFRGRLKEAGAVIFYLKKVQKHFMEIFKLQQVFFTYFMFLFDFDKSLGDYNLFFFRDFFKSF